jgi:hypothetical protein
MNQRLFVVLPLAVLSFVVGCASPDADTSAPSASADHALTSPSPTLAVSDSNGGALGAPVVWACNVSDSTSLVFIQDGHHAKGTLQLFKGSQDIQAEVATLAGGAGAPLLSKTDVTFKQKDQLVTFSDAHGKGLLVVELDQEKTDDTTEYPWTGTVPGTSLVAGCWGLPNQS